MDDGRGRFRGRTPAEPVRRPIECGPQLQGALAARADAIASGTGDGQAGTMEAVARLERADPTGRAAAGKGRGRRNEPELRVTTLPYPGSVKLGKFRKLGCFLFLCYKFY